jgi:hypothetical protein
MPNGNIGGTPREHPNFKKTKTNGPPRLNNLVYQIQFGNMMKITSQHHQFFK